MIEIENPELRQLKLVKMLNSVKFVVEPQNVVRYYTRKPLRRIPIFITRCSQYIEIEGVLHEFSAIDNVVEDVSTIL